MDIRTLYLTSHKARPFMARPIIIFFLIIATSTSLHKPLKTIFEDNSEKMWIKQDELKVKDLAKNLGKENLLRLLSTLPKGQSHRMWKRQDDHKAKHLEGQLEDLVRFLSFMEENLDKVEEEVMARQLEAQLQDLGRVWKNFLAREPNSLQRLSKRSQRGIFKAQSRQHPPTHPSGRWTRL